MQTPIRRQQAAQICGVGRQPAVRRSGRAGQRFGLGTAEPLRVVRVGNSIWQTGAVVLGLLWLLGLSLRVHRLSRRVTPLELAARTGRLRPSVSVAELIARADATGGPEPAADMRSSASAQDRSDAETTAPLTRPRQRILLGPSAPVTEDDSGSWFRPACPSEFNRPAGTGC